MLRALIVDDEPLTRRRILSMLNRFGDLVVVGDCGTVAEASILIHASRPDLLLLDIQLPDGSGFDLLQSLPGISFHVVFVTAYTEFAVKAIKYGALDYLLKPVDEQELVEAIDKARRAHIPEKEVMDSLDVIRSYWLHPEGGPLREIVLRSQTSLQKVQIEEIAYCRSSDNYTHFFLTEKRRIVASKTLKEFQELLPSKIFIRPHFSFLVNTRFIERFDYHRDYLVLKTGEEIPVSVRRKPQVMAHYQKD